jgi:outer membrane protein TolC
MHPSTFHRLQIPSSAFRKVGLLAFLMLFSLSAIQAQRETISLSDAIVKALDQNFDIRLEEKRQEITALNNTWGTAGRYPNITLQLASNNRFSNIDNPASFLNGSFSSIGGTGTLNAAWTLFDGFRVNLTKARLEKLEEQSAGNAALVIENTLQAVILQYYSSLVEQEALKVLEANLNLSRDRLNFAQTKLELGSGSTFEVLTFRTSYLADSSNYLLQRLNLDNALRALGQLLGDKTDVSYELADLLPTQFEEYRMEDLSGKMEANNRTLQNQFINLEILQKDLDLARSSRYPTLALNLGGTYALSRFQLQGLEARSGNQADFYANFSLNFTLFNGGAITRGIEAAQINERLGMLSIQQLKHTMNYQLLNAFELYRTRRQMLAVADATREAALQNENIAGDKFRNGTLSSFDYRNVQVALLQASLTRIRALFSVLDAQTQLLRLTGGILDMGE